ncbi:hypothetical protein KUCAC02_019339 [Chaenocephalus aceratus]|nr:hypothetical protein KUCAC02_019339 [Chaenocephalus aceratus]
METPRKVLLTTLNNLEKKDLKTFKWYLAEEVLKFPGIPKSELEKAADRMDTVDLMFLYYGIHTIKVTIEVLKEIPRNDLVKKLSEFPSDPEGWSTVESRGSEQEETTSCPGGDHFLSWGRPLPVLGLHVGVLNGGFSLVTVCLTDCNKVFLKQRVKDCDRHQVQ